MKERDIILLSMSTLPRSIHDTSTFTTPEGDEISNCISQLECVVRYLLSKNDHDVTIVPICTRETLLPQENLTVSKSVAEIVNEKWGEEVFVSSTGNNESISEKTTGKTELPNPNESASKEKDSFWNRARKKLFRRDISVEFDDTKQVSPDNPLRWGINSRVHFSHTPKMDDERSENTNEKSQSQDVSNVSKSTNDNAVYKLSENQNVSAYQFFKNQIKSCEEKDGKVIDFYDNSNDDLPIIIDQANILPAIKRTTDELRKLLKKYPNSHLYIDNHGGFRDISLVLCAVSSLLKYDEPGSTNIPEKVYGVRNEPNQPGKKIVDETKTYAIFDFITGMNDFINFGSAKMLSEYYQKYGDHSDRTNKITDAMQNVSDGTQLCSSDLYVKGLRELNTQFKEAENVQKTKGKQDVDELFQIFENNIKQDYGTKLLNSTSADSMSSFEIVERCVNKGLYQQALTFAESQMPKYFCDYIVQIPNIDQQKKHYKSVKSRVANNSWKSFENQIIDCLITAITKDSVSNLKTNDKDRGKRIIIPKQLNGIITNIEDRHVIPDEQLIAIYKRMGKCEIENNQYYSSKSKSYTTYIELTSSKNGPNQEKRMICKLKPRNVNSFDPNEFLLLLLIHGELKTQRNRFNHSDSNNKPDVQKLDTLFKKYIELVKDLSIAN